MNRVIERFASTYTYQRPGAQTIVDGRTRTPTLGSPTDFRASIQPLNGRELLLLPEGERDREYIKIYTDLRLLMSNPATKTKGDLVNYKGVVWTVIQTNDWNLNDYAHFKFHAVSGEVD